jgi:hypothetical protein
VKVAEAVADGSGEGASVAGGAAVGGPAVG